MNATSLTHGVMAWFMVIGLVLAVVLFFLPTIIAIKRGSPATAGAIILNLLFGFTVVGWIVALVLAFKEKPQVVVVHQHIYSPAAPPALPPRR